MEEKQRKLQQDSALSDEALAEVVGGAQSAEFLRCDGCGRGYAPAALYALGARKLCPACYRKEIKR